MTIEEQKRLVKAGTIFVVVLFAIIFVSFHFLFIWEDRLHLSDAMKSGISGFAALRMIVPAIYVMWFLPGAVLSEFADSWVKKRSFRPLNVLIFLLFLSEFVVIAVALLTLFDLLLPRVSFLIQFPLIAVSLSIPTLVMVATLRIGTVQKFMKKAFE